MVNYETSIKRQLPSRNIQIQLHKKKINEVPPVQNRNFALKLQTFSKSEFGQKNIINIRI